MATAKRWRRARWRQQQRWQRRRRGLCLATTATRWKKWRHQGWNDDGKKEATGTTAATATAAARSSLGGRGREMRLERQRRKRRRRESRRGQRQRQHGLRLEAAAATWLRWNGDRETAATGNAKGTVTAVARALPGGDSNAVAKMTAARLEQ